MKLRWLMLEPDAPANKNAIFRRFNHSYVLQVLVPQHMDIEGRRFVPAAWEDVPIEVVKPND